MDQTKYVEWFSASEIHQVTQDWYSEISFIKDEQLFFDDLIKSYTNRFIESKYFKASQKIVNKLAALQKQTGKLLTAVETHRNKLKILVDGVNQIEEETSYKKEHKALVETLAEFKKDYNQFKTAFFQHISIIIKEDKQKRLLDK